MLAPGRKGPHNLSFLTNYRPNFCSECGEKIVRLRWRVWTSRRYCDKCSARFVKPQFIRRVLLTIALVIVGVLFGRGCRQERPPLVIHRPASAPSQSSSTSPSPIPTEQSYTCGARTKKGTPCSRRVHGPVRCWQHKGAAAMLPPEKLLIKE
jgi:hypothetical protein